MEYHLNNKSKNPIEIIQGKMNMPNRNMHGPEHHIMVGSALLTAYKNAGVMLIYPNLMQLHLTHSQMVIM